MANVRPEARERFSPDTSLSQETPWLFIYEMQFMWLTELITLSRLRGIRISCLLFFIVVDSFFTCIVLCLYVSVINLHHTFKQLSVFPSSLRERAFNLRSVSSDDPLSVLC